MNKVHVKEMISILMRGIPRNQGYITLNITAKRKRKTRPLFDVSINNATHPPRNR
jgi:hypothetical protein